MRIEFAGSPPPDCHSSIAVMAFSPQIAPLARSVLRIGSKPLKKGEAYTPTLLDSMDLAKAKSYLASLPTRGRVETEPMERRNNHAR